jgi:hypothetical protein
MKQDQIVKVESEGVIVPEIASEETYPQLYTVAEVNEAHRRFIRDAARIQNLGNLVRLEALAIGKFLSEEKSKLPHGEWEDWMKANLQFTKRTAQRYMSVWEEREEIGWTWGAILWDHTCELDEENAKTTGHVVFDPTDPTPAPDPITAPAVTPLKFPHNYETTHSALHTYLRSKEKQESGITEKGTMMGWVVIGKGFRKAYPTEEDARAAAAELTQKAVAALDSSPASAPTPAPAPPPASVTQALKQLTKKKKSKPAPKPKPQSVSISPEEYLQAYQGNPFEALTHFLKEAYQYEEKKFGEEANFGEEFDHCLASLDEELTRKIIQQILYSVIGHAVDYDREQAIQTFNDYLELNPDSKNETS